MGQEGATPLFEHKKPRSLVGRHLRTSHGKKRVDLPLNRIFLEVFLSTTPSFKLTEAIERPAQ